jgi:hypothetical protein
VRRATMDARAEIHAAIDGLSDEQIEEVAQVIGVVKNKIREVADTVSNGTKLSLMEKLRQIKIDAPADFSERILRARHGDFGGD